MSFGSAAMIRINPLALAEKTHVPVHDDIFSIIDRDHNGVLSEAELQEALKGDIISTPLVNHKDGTSNMPPVEAKSCRKATQRDQVTKRVSCIGDSITRGACSSDGMDMSYPDQLQSLLGDTYNVSKYAADGRGVMESGFFPIWNEDELMGDVMASEPDIVLIMFGTNDAKVSGFSETEFKTGYHKLIEMFNGLPSKPTVYLLTPPPVYSADMEDHSIIARNVNDKLVPMLQDIATTHQLKVIDVFSNFQAKCPDLDSTTCRYIAHNEPPAELGIICDNDYVHPSDEGYDVIAKLVYQTIK